MEGPARSTTIRLTEQIPCATGTRPRLRARRGTGSRTTGHGHAHDGGAGDQRYANGPSSPVAGPPRALDPKRPEPPTETLSMTPETGPTQRMLIPAMTRGDRLGIDQPRCLRRESGGLQGSGAGAGPGRGQQADFRSPVGKRAGIVDAALHGIGFGGAVADLDEVAPSGVSEDNEPVAGGAGCSALRLGHGAIIASPAGLRTCPQPGASARRARPPRVAHVG